MEAAPKQGDGGREAAAGVECWDLGASHWEGRPAGLTDERRGEGRGQEKLTPGSDLSLGGACGGPAVCGRCPQDC